MSRKLNFKQVEMLWTVVTSGSISAAAKQLDVTQPAISRMLAQTEAQVGIELFERIRGRLRPTKALNDLLPEIERAQKALQRVNDMTRAIADSRGGVLKVASNPSLSTHVMPRALAAFRARHPGTFLRFQTETTIQEVAEKLLSGEVDTAVLSIPAEHPFLSSQVLCEGRLVAALPVGYEISSRRRVSLQDLAALPQIVVGERLHFGMVAANAFARAGLSPQVFADVPTSHLACAMVNTGVGYAIVDEFSVMENIWPNVRIVPIDAELPLRMLLVHAADRPQSDVSRRFAQVLRAMYRAE
ncbi:LysR family transcriptional regulator [Bordetella petrii]|uniref:LysR family transcriptional regulator n=1 Tax=Bordetella petrii TaxID=94624 RepID=UPI001A95650B|nr:LysR family transcriptional regulator [Bordetella petrii]MBO1113812.1 LysR family transcriptional regulator [Bordetella petrii]